MLMEALLNYLTLFVCL